MRASVSLLLLLLIEIFAFAHASYPGEAAMGQMYGFNVKNRKRKVYTVDTDSVNVGLINLEDYRRIDPVPSSKTSIRHGSIQHGTPLMPYIPRSSPPPVPVHGPLPPGKPKRGG